MLQELRIENLALIDKLQLDFGGSDAGLIVFSGETGAGKSIILQAIHLLTGGRGISSWIRSDCQQAVIEAFFVLHDEHREIHQLLQSQGLENKCDCIIRRVLNRNNRSRVYVNDRLVTARFAAKLAENLVSVASQHDHQQLLLVSRHLTLLDSFAELDETRRQFSALFTKWQQKSTQLKKLREQEQEKEQRRDFLRFQLSEIQEAQISLPEDGELVFERDRLKSSGILIKLAAKSHGLLQAKIMDSLREVHKNMEQVATLDPEARELSQRISSLNYELEDIESMLLEYRNSIPMNQAKLEDLNARIAQLKQLQRKYGPNLVDVVSYLEKAERELASLDTMGEQITVLEEVVSGLEREVLSEANQLSLSRKEAASRLGDAMQHELSSLSFPQSIFEVSINRSQQPGISGVSASGMDLVEFLFSANPGEPAKPLAKIVSGGELSRLMLALKCLLARRDQVETVIFDEIDAGIGGKAAEAVALKIDELAQHHQVFCITHLPQIAAHAAEHFEVSKNVTQGRTHTDIKLLQKDDRVAEIARMLGGENLTKETIAFAQDLVARKGNGGNR